MSTQEQIVGKAVVEIEGQGISAASNVHASFEGTNVSLFIELEGPPRLVRTFRFVFPDRSAHLDYQKFEALYTDDDRWNHYRYDYKAVSGGADTMIDNEGMKVRGAFNLKMKLTEEDPGAGHPEIVVHGWFDLPNPDQAKANHE
ncbi:hypothetical protein SAMN05216509_0567 [Pseudomonas sp. B10]|uniref:hypothetical protein n=1 Tax=Pseudomonas sp. B10 TaxID=118613 RepID=UPI000953810E|nr:hypothetical protein [Pseudomonas sp. B10]SIR10812.1 hypothetical protein SAMN05216509_0567 [Pseudomonas sp. B10]